MTATYVTETKIVSILGVIQTLEHELTLIYESKGTTFVTNRKWSCEFVAEILRAVQSGQPAQIAHQTNINRLKNLNLTTDQANHLLTVMCIELSEAINAVMRSVVLGESKYVDFQQYGIYDLIVIVSEPLPHEDNYYPNI